MALETPLQGPQNEVLWLSQFFLGRWKTSQSFWNLNLIILKFSNLGVSGKYNFDVGFMGSSCKVYTTRIASQSSPNFDKVHGCVTYPNFVCDYINWFLCVIDVIERWMWSDLPNLIMDIQCNSLVLRQRSLGIVS
jgi:hypothetical protein